MTTVLYHSADFDGIFCREIARKFLGEAEVTYIGWNFGDPAIPIPPDGTIYIMDLPVDKPLGLSLVNGWILPEKDGTAGPDLKGRVVWIDHHKSSLEQAGLSGVSGYRIDGVAACRLVWQWFAHSVDHASKIGHGECIPNKADFLERAVREPRAVQLAGEYDVWDHRGDGDLEFQFGLRSLKELNWLYLLAENQWGDDEAESVVALGRTSMAYAANMAALWLKEAHFLLEWEGLKFLVLNTVERSSLTFAALDVPATGHDALMAFGWRGKYWTFSLYHASHRKDLDLSAIAVKYGGGGHRGAAGFVSATLPFQLV